MDPNKSPTTVPNQKIAGQTFTGFTKHTEVPHGLGNSPVHNSNRVDVSPAPIQKFKGSNLIRAYCDAGYHQSGTNLLEKKSDEENEENDRKHLSDAMKLMKIMKDDKKLTDTFFKIKGEKQEVHMHGVVMSACSKWFKKHMDYVVVG